MRETLVPQISIFEFYSEHEFGKRLKTLSRLLDEHAETILPLIEKWGRSELILTNVQKGPKREVKQRCCRKNYPFSVFE